MAPEGVPKQALNQDNVFFTPQWTRAVDRQFISLLIDHLESSAWIVGDKNERAIRFSSHDLNRFTRIGVNYELCKIQTKKLHKRYKVWKWLINLPYVNYDATTNRVRADDATWKNIISQQQLAAAYYREGEQSSHELRRLFDEEYIPPPSTHSYSVIEISSDTERSHSVEIINNPNPIRQISYSSNLSYFTEESSMQTDDAFWNEHAWLTNSTHISHGTGAIAGEERSPAQSTNSPIQPLNPQQTGKHRARRGAGSSSIASWSPFR